MIDGEADGTLLEKTYEELSDALKEVEKTREEYCLLLEEDQLDAEDSYLDEASNTLAQIHVSVNKAVTDAKNKVAIANETQRKKDCTKVTCSI